jgi:hypothetical protein
MHHYGNFDKHIGPKRKFRWNVTNVGWLWMTKNNCQWKLDFDSGTDIPWSGLYDQMDVDQILTQML